jgi:hypothetical protein
MLQVPVAYDGTVQVPKPSHPVLKDHFVHLGEGNYGVRGYGMICVPAIVDVIRECTDMPRDFDAKKHNWLQLANNPQPRTALTSLDMIPS